MSIRLYDASGITDPVLLSWIGKHGYRLPETAPDHARLANTSIGIMWVWENEQGELRGWPARL